MQFEERVDGDSEGRMFRVKSTDPRGPNLTYVCQAEDPETRARSKNNNNKKNKSKVCSSTFWIFPHCRFAQVDRHDGKAAADTEGIPASSAGSHCLPQQAVERAVSNETGQHQH